MEQAVAPAFGRPLSGGLGQELQAGRPQPRDGFERRRPAAGQPMELATWVNPTAERMGLLGWQFSQQLMDMLQNLQALSPDPLQKTVSVGAPADLELSVIL